ncbi:MAG: hypothetical protein IT305_13600 [Chloroflexi bacterium]|nr:hypothetical protein [Chloroflexota bacterium]
MRRVPFLRATVALTLGLCIQSGAAFASPQSSEAQSVALPTVRVATAGQSRCGTELSTLGASCRGFDGRDVRSLPDLWVVGYENNSETGEKHVMQTVLTVNLTPLRSVKDPNAISRVVLGYTEASTTHRSPEGESEYGILPTCNTGLGVPTDAWNGKTDSIVPTRPAAIAGVEGATTASSGAWDVTPQVKEWLAAPDNERTFVLRSDDESTDIHAQAMCLSYIFDVGASAEVAAE